MDHIIDLLKNKKAFDICAFSSNESDNFSSYEFANIIICSTYSTAHAKAVAKSIKVFLKNNNKNVIVEGMGSANWIPLIYDSTIINICLLEARIFYELDEFYKNRPGLSVID